jgi:hypothetical protein
MRTTHQIVLDEEYIAESQRLGIAQVTALRLMYQTWWFLWIPRVVLAGTIIYFLLNDSVWFAMFCGAVLAGSFLGQHLFQRNLAKGRRKFRAKGTTSTVSMDENGIDLLGAFGNSHLKWIAVLQPVIYANGVLIKLSRVSMLWLPDQSLIEGTPVDVRRLLAENVKQSAGANQ